jgi:PAS domain S-box-containing protein
MKIPEPIRDERKLIDFVDTAAIGLHWVGSDGTILWANPSDYEPLGYAADEYIGHNIQEFHADADIIADILRRLAAGERLSDHEAVLRCKDGSTRNVCITSSVLFENGEFVHTRCFTRDITERKTLERERDEKVRALIEEVARRERVEEELRRVNAVKEEASRAKDDFLAMLGHELRNPLSPIITALELMKLRGEPPRREHDVIERQVRHLVRLVDDLLDVSRIARGKVELRCDVVEIAHVVTQAIEMATPLIDERGHRLTVELAAELPLLVKGDAVRLAQVVANLLTNAARYTPKGGEIRVSTERVAERIVIRVTDNGAGIAPDLLPQVFELFVQGKRTSDRAEGGLGLGLAIVQNLVRLHHGIVSAHSEGPGTGSTFVVELPATGQPPQATQVEEALASAPQHCRRVLVVDDNADAADMLAQILRSNGHEVMVANSGPQALTMVDDFQPQVAVLDIGLPVMDGYELATLLRQRKADCKLVALTGYGHEAARAKARDSGFDAHFVKPVKFPVIAREICS